ncbi:hypothetical protein pb186bvf_014290 [Paramecium bursaria]
MNFDKFLQGVYQNLFQGQADNRIMVGFKIKQLQEDAQNTQSQIEFLQNRYRASNNYNNYNNQETQELNNKICTLEQLNNQLKQLKKEKEEIDRQVKPILQYELTKSKEQQQSLIQQRQEILLQKQMREQSINTLDLQLEILKNELNKYNQSLDQNKLNQEMDQIYCDNLQVQTNSIDIKAQHLKDSKTKLYLQQQNINQEKETLLIQKQDLEQKLIKLKQQKQEMSNLEYFKEQNKGQNNHNQQSEFQSTIKDLERKKTEILKEIQELINHINKNSQNVENQKEQNAIIDVEIQKLNQQQNDNDEKFAQLVDDYERISSKIGNFNEDLKFQEQQQQSRNEQIQKNKEQQSNIDLQIKRLQKDIQQLNNFKYDIEKQCFNKERELEKLISEEQGLGVWDDQIKEKKSIQEEITKLNDEKSKKEEELKHLQRPGNLKGKSYSRNKYQKQNALNALNNFIKRLEERSKVLNQVSEYIQDKESKLQAVKQKQAKNKEETSILQVQIVSINEQMNGNKRYVDELDENLIVLRNTLEQLENENHQIQRQYQSTQREIEKSQNNQIKIEQKWNKIQDDIRQIQYQKQQKLEKQAHLFKMQSEIKSEIQVLQRDLQTMQGELHKAESDIKLNYQLQDQVYMKQQLVDEQKFYIKQQVQLIEGDIKQIEQDYVTLSKKKLDIDKDMSNQISLIDQIDKQIEALVQEKQAKNYQYGICMGQIQNRQSLIEQDQDKLRNINDQITQKVKIYQEEQFTYKQLQQNLQQINEKLKDIQLFQQLIEKEILEIQEFKIDPSLQFRQQ